jgi:hypothetical protein
MIAMPIETPNWRRMTSLLDRPISGISCVIGWISASTLFVGLTALIGGPSESDASVSAYITLSIAHGNFACSYAPIGTFHHIGIAYPYVLIAPLYPLLSGGFLALTHLTNSVPFPAPAQLEPHCLNTYTAMYGWLGKSDAILTTVRVGYLTWLALVAGAVAVLRAAGRGRRGWEPVALVLLAIAPPVLECLTIYFHPQDLMAMGLVLGCLACAIRRRWALTGVLLGLAFVTNQFVLLVAAPLFVLVPKGHRARFVGAASGSIALVALPMILVTSGGALKPSVIGSGFEVIFGGTVLAETHLKGGLLFAVSRLLPIVLSMLIARWASRRLGDKVLEPIPLLSIIAMALSLRLVFEIYLWGYYFMATAVLFILIDVIAGQIRGHLLAWLALGALVFNPVPLVVVSNYRSWDLSAHELMPQLFAAVALALILIDLARRHIRWYIVGWLALVSLTFVKFPWYHEVLRHPMPKWFWQIIIVPIAVGLAASPLLSAVRKHSEFERTSANAKLNG